MKCRPMDDHNKQRMKLLAMSCFLPSSCEWIAVLTTDQSCLEDRSEGPERNEKRFFQHWWDSDAKQV